MGSGKTAIFLKLLSEYEKEKNNFVINLKPEADELLIDLEHIIKFESESVKKSFFISIWTVVIFSRLLKNIYNRINSVKFRSNTQAELKILSFVEEHKDLINKGVFGLIREIEKSEGLIIKTEQPEALQKLYEGYLSNLIKNVKEYFRENNFKFYQIVILADGLDQTWDIRYGLDAQADLILTLIDSENKILEKLRDNKDHKIKLKKIIFLRKDIYEFILEKSTESHKISLMKHEIDWNNYPNLLRDVLEKRFRYVLELEEGTAINSIWRDFFHEEIYPNAFEITKQIVENRPRDVIYFFSRLFEEAINKGREIVRLEDFNYAIDSYFKFLNNDLAQEIKADYIDANRIINKLSFYDGKTIDLLNFSKIIKSCKKTEDRKKLLNILFQKNFIILFDIKTKKIIDNSGQLIMKTLNFFHILLNQNRYAVLIRPKYYVYLQNKSK